MSTFHYIKNDDFTDTLKIARILLYDQQDLIHKAVGWMLREIGKRQLKEEEAFLKKHYLKMPRTMLRYAIEKFPEPKRKRYLKRPNLNCFNMGFGLSQIKSLRIFLYVCRPCAQVFLEDQRQTVKYIFCDLFCGEGQYFLIKPQGITFEMHYHNLKRAYSRTNYLPARGAIFLTNGLSLGHPTAISATQCRRPMFSIPSPNLPIFNII